MGNNELRTLAKNYSLGLISQENYRLERKNLLDSITDNAKKTSTAITTPVEQEDSHAGETLELSSNPAKSSFKDKQLQFYFIGISILLAITLAAIVFYSSQNDTGSPAFDLGGNEQASPIDKLHVASNVLIERNNWSNHHLDDFLDTWNRLSRQQKMKAMRTTWLNIVKTSVSTQLEDQKELAKIGNATLDMQRLNSMVRVLAMDFASAPPERSDEDIEKDIAAINQSMAKHIKNEKKKPRDASATKPESKTTPKRKDATNKVATKTKTTKPKVAPKPVPQVARKAAPKPINIVTEPRAKIKKVTIAKQPIPKFKKKESRKAKKLRPLKTLIQQYEKAYTDGDIENMMNLISASALINHQSTNYLIRKDYTDLFQNSADRKIKISKIQWDSSKTHAKGSGTYFAKYQVKKNKTHKTIKGKIIIEVQKYPNKFEISRFQITNKTVNSSSTINKPKASSAPKYDALPTTAELQALVSQFTSAYQEGDLKMLMSLFAKDARTNDQTSAAGIQTEYESLFRGSNDREIFFNDLNWKFENRTAAASGNIIVNVHGNKKQGLSTFKGRIRIIAKKIGKRVVITHMFHNT